MNQKRSTVVHIVGPLPNGTLIPCFPQSQHYHMKCLVIVRFKASISPSLAKWCVVLAASFYIFVQHQADNTFRMVLNSFKWTIYPKMKILSAFTHPHLHSFLSPWMPFSFMFSVFLCPVSSPVDLLIMQALCWVHDDLNQVDLSSYVLKVCGQEEVLQNKHSLGSHEYVQNCRKWETEIKLQLLFLSTMRRDLARTAEDDISPIVLEKYLGLVERPFKESSTQYKTVDNVVQSVKNLCCALDEVETPAISDAIKKLKRSVNLPRTRSPEVSIYSNLSFLFFSFEKYYLMCALTHNNRNLFKPVQSKKVGTYKSFFYHIKWDELINFPISVALLPLEAMLSLSLYGVLNQNANNSPDSNKQRKGPELLGKVSMPLFDFRRLSRADKQLLWDQRYYCRDYQHSLFADTEVRKVAVSWIESSSDDELADYLPQLVQAVKFECHLNNALVIFLLSRALGNVNIAHYLYCQFIKILNHYSFNNLDAVQDPAFGQRYDRILGVLLCLCGTGLRTELEKQTRLVQLLGALAEKVRQASSSTRQVSHGCLSVLTVIQVGEDLRQDMLALQMIRIMDRIWLQEGLDLRIVNFKCISTGKDKGMVELVPSSETLRKIQVENGVTGSFKDKPLAEWLRKYNPAEDEYEKASENFIYTCAGCCVATYILGICDRHNDNIMLRSTGHMFHIDFGKFLGHAQMIGSFKRDRAPFVLTSDMAYVINGGERPTSRFQLFVDLCSQAYNLIRKHSNLFLNLLSLMTQSGLPELTGVQDLKYVYDALQPQTTDAEATIFFTRLIESSLGSVATKFNFFIHNLAQLRFSGLPSNDEPILSFAPRTYTMKQDGRIRDASVFSFQKRYNPDKHYTYVIRILREGQNEPQFVFRTFDEFQELHNKLTILFPLWKLPGFPSKMVLGRTHIKDVASKRKVELSSYVHNLMRSSTEVTQCDIIYTFFHPIARDDKTEGVEGLSKTPDMPPVSPTTGRVEGEVKLSVSYRNSTLFIMVMHIKDLISNDGADPNPYVKTYLLPDPHKTSKRKTKIARKTRNPTFNEMLVYSGYSKETLKQRELQLSVLSAESLRENCYLGGITLSLKDFDLSRETVKWYKLTTVPYF
uniref:Phosphatidylinositol-4-phosphate 3-kinase, catalytic subunit type 2 alpha n=1 Tax=Cyprinus carpio TaxID=7962 RepID=A0A8C1N217_CYPCA